MARPLLLLLMVLVMMVVGPAVVPSSQGTPPASCCRGGCPRQQSLPTCMDSCMLQLSLPQYHAIRDWLLLLVDSAAVVCLNLLVLCHVPTGTYNKQRQ
jgi:hypothetical protein